jgi:hypothetical protein
VPGSGQQFDHRSQWRARPVRSRTLLHEWRTGPPVHQTSRFAASRLYTHRPSRTTFPSGSQLIRSGVCTSTAGCTSLCGPTPTRVRSGGTPETQGVRGSDMERGFGAEGGWILRGGS